MAIFVALIFQVLFVFFAMAINIGLVVHDKINLQNAADLAAYYAAQRQAQWLNVMAHQNYQIRQSYKLMAWRYRVLGTMGIQGNPGHPAQVNAAGEDVLDPVVGDFPVACAAYQPNWEDIGSNDSLCKTRFSATQMTTIINQIEVPPVVNTFGPWNFSLRNLVQNVNDQIFRQCNSYGGYNYLFTNLIKLNYRIDQYKLKKVILAEAANLAKPQNEILDIDGQSVYQGVFQTVMKNLTFANRNSIGDGDITMLNSIEGLRPEQWLNELKVNMNMIYVDVDTTAGGCRSDPKQVHEQPNSSSGLQSLVNATGQSVARLEELFADPPATDLRRMSLGFEKNPWVKLYMGVRIRSRPRQIFFPFGEPVQFEAVAYATPFGGRIGPWYKNFWPRGADQSSGNKIDAKIVPLVSDSSGGLSNADQRLLLPNYSRYPGDPLGLESSLAQSSLIGLSGMRSRLTDFGESLEVDPGKIPDPLVWNGSLLNTTLRNFEIAAVAPDLFDIAYYSIEPNYGRTYLPKLRANVNRFGFSADAIPRFDLGNREDVDNLNGFSIQDQLALVGANSVQLGSGLSPANLHRPEAFYFIRDRAHLLTSWVHNNVVGDFSDFPEERFGKCETYDDEYAHQIPGACLFNGGRTGYSVKIISGRHLRSEGLQYGGPNQTGSILNPPPDNW